MKRVKSFFTTLKEIYKKLKDPFWRAKSKYITYFDHLPLDEYGILLESEHGKKLDGNIFYLLRYLSNSEKYSQYKIYLSAWGRNVKKFEEFLEAHGIEHVKVVMLASDEYVRLLASVKYLINDTSFASYFIKKEGQVYLNTWHGTPLKTLGRSDKSESYKMGNVQKNFVCSDFLLFPNEYTKRCMVKDYMLENISNGQTIYSGYPRNEAFFDQASVERIKTELVLEGKRIYVYMPTYRTGTKKKGYVSRGDAYLLFFLYEIDKKLREDEIFFTNLHPLAGSKVDFQQFKHIRPFPKEYETYEFLNIADVLITDYSSVFFDFACSRKKIILFPYDKEDYLHDRGMYFDMDELPFPQAETVDVLIRELRNPKQYDDRNFIEKFCPWEGSGASQKLCDYVILGENAGLETQKIPSNGKENVLIYAGNLDANGITTSLRSLSNIIDLQKRNYYITFISEKVAQKGKLLSEFPAKLCYYPCTGDMNLTINERIIRKLFKLKVLPVFCYMKLMRRRIHQDLKRKYGTAKFDTMIQFNGYEDEVILGLSTFEGRKVIFVHNDMLAEIDTRRNQRHGVLAYAYQKYDKVAAVTKDVLEATKKISKGNGNVVVCRNAIDYSGILKRAEAEIFLEPETEVFPNREFFFEIIGSDVAKFISVGRFSPEKGHLRLVRAFYHYWSDHPDAVLIIMGGNSKDGFYEKTIETICSLGLEKNVILLCRVLNPYPIIKACDYFVLSSLYEGFGLVLVEADILGKPVVSTDIVGPRTFMNQHGGILVESSEDGIFEGIKMLSEGKVQPLNVDYEAYNQEVVQEFEELFDGDEQKA